MDKQNNSGYNMKGCQKGYQYEPLQIEELIEELVGSSCHEEITDAYLKGDNE